MTARLLLVAAALTVAANVAAAPRLYCHIEQGGTSRDLQFGAVGDPYTVPSVAINDLFRFKAVMVGDGRQVDYIKLYTYYQAKRQAVLLHQASYLAPQVQNGANPAALTGAVFLYSPMLGHELRYSCALREDG